VSTKVTVNDIFPSTKAAFSFKIPDHKSGKVSEMQFMEIKLVKKSDKTKERKRKDCGHAAHSKIIIIIIIITAHPS
jgi:hypothetical protein